MKRDMDLIRRLLFHLEEKPDDQPVLNVPIHGRSPTEVYYHYRLTYEAGLINAEPDLSDHGRIIRVTPFSLTWEGHEFVDLSRNESIWKKAKAHAKAGGFAALKIALTELAKSVASGTGITPPLP